MPPGPSFDTLHPAPWPLTCWLPPDWYAGHEKEEAKALLRDIRSQFSQLPNAGEN